MWVAKIKIKGEGSIIGSAMRKSGASGSGYPISSRQVGENMSVYFIGFLKGSDEQKECFMEEIKKHPRMVHIEREGDCIISEIKEPSNRGPGYSPHLIHIDPILIKDDGSQYWTIGSWEKKHLINFITSLERTHEVELLNMSCKKITNFSPISSNPPLSPKQRMAIDIAVREGYYEYPRKIELRKLAEIAGISYSTYQAHLRKAEMKLIPFSLDKTV